jgi:hypothetical protein
MVLALVPAELGVNKYGQVRTPVQDFWVLII